MPAAIFFRILLFTLRKILAICGSLQSTSSNRALIERVRGMAMGTLDVTLYDALASLPHFNPDLEKDGTLPVVDELRRSVAASDALLIACPEYGHSLPGALKNAVDWLIGTGELERKKVAITAATAGLDRGKRGLLALRTTLGAVSAQILWDEPIPRGETMEDALRALVGVLATSDERDPSSTNVACR